MYYINVNLFFVIFNTIVSLKKKILNEGKLNNRIHQNANSSASNHQLPPLTIRNFV